LDRMAKDDTVRAGLRDAGIRRAGHFTFEKFTTERIVAIQRLLSGHK
jgi:hypothetical protein